jgi:endoglucanase
VHDDNVIWSFHSYDPFTFTHQYAGWTQSPLMFLQGIPYPPSALTDRDTVRLAAEAAVRAARSTDFAAEDVTFDTFMAVLDDYRTLPDDTATEGVAAAVQWAGAHAIPRNRLLLGEFGAMGYDENGQTWGEPARHTFLHDVSHAAEAAGIGWAVWEWRGSMRVSSDDTTRAMDPAICTALNLAGCAGAAP